MLVPSKMLYWKSANLFKNTYSKCGVGLQPGTSPVVSFSKIFSIWNTYFQEHLRVCVCFFVLFCLLTAMCQARIYSLCFCLFLQKIRRPVLFSTSWLLLIVIDKFANRSSCECYFRRFGNFPRERLQWNFFKQPFRRKVL